MQTEKAKEFASFLYASINCYTSYFRPNMSPGAGEKEFQTYYVPATFDKFFVGFLKELIENITEYQDIQIIHDYIKTQFHVLAYYFVYGMGSNEPIFEKGEDITFLLTLKKQIEIYLEKIKAWHGKNAYQNTPTDSLIELFNSTIKAHMGNDDKTELSTSSESTEEDEKIEETAPAFDERFDFAKVKKECDQLTGTLTKITFIKERLFDLQQWQLQYDKKNKGYDNGYAPNSYYIYSEQYYPNLLELCNLELQRLNERFKSERQYGQESTNEKDLEAVTTRYHWKASDTDLLELVTALHKEKAIQRKDGKETTRKELLGLFEQLFGKKIKDAEGKLAKATERKINPTVFLNKLQNAFMGYAEEKLEKR